jgi:hypothetical protein
MSISEVPSWQSNEYVDRYRQLSTISPDGTQYARYFDFNYIFLGLNVVTLRKHGDVNELVAGVVE